MKTLILPLLPLLLGCAVFASSAGAQTTQDASADNSLENLKFTTLTTIINNNAYTTTVEVNGAAFANKGDGSELESHPALPFKQGANHVVITMSPIAGMKKSDAEAKVQLILADRLFAAQDHTAPLCETDADDGDYGIVDLKFDFADGKVSNIQMKEDDWADADHKKHTYELTTTGTISGPSQTHSRSWTPEGEPIAETHYQLRGSPPTLWLVESKNYKPDGSLGAEVKDGEGFERKYFETGPLNTETTIHAGQPNGTYKEFDDKGTLRIAGTYKDGDQDGTWTRYGENGKKIRESVYENGEPRAGDKPIEPGTGMRIFLGG